MDGPVTRHAGKTLAVLPVALLLGGCVMQAEPQRYYFTEGLPPSLFSGELDGLSGDVKIRIDGKPVLAGSIPSFSESLALQGEYRGQQLDALCKMVYCTNSISCFIHVDHQPAALLEFGKP